MRATRERLTGFTVVEALILLLVIVVLAAIFAPIFITPRHDNCARMTQCMSNQKQIALAVTMYTQENHETMPGLASERSVNTSYTWRTAIGVADKVYNCTACRRDGSIIMPATKTTGPEFGMNTCLYGVYLGMIFAPEVTILTADANANGIASPADFASHHNDKRGLIASFCDGHVEYIVTANLPKDAWRVGSDVTPALFRPGLPGPATTYLNPKTDFSPYLLTGASGMLLTLQDRAHSSALAGITLPKQATLLRGKTLVIKIGEVAAGDKPSMNSPVSWSVDQVTLLDYYRHKPAPGDVPSLRYGLAAGDYRVGTYAVIKP
ncbi:MAG TPA: DUF1559 domain-containing protein [Armatimonadota bacterium]|jgi:prepilin-type processing-associated H-X9-DG protein